MVQIAFKSISIIVPTCGRIGTGHIMQGPQEWPYVQSHPICIRSSSKTQTLCPGRQVQHRQQPDRKRNPSIGYRKEKLPLLR